MLSHTITALVPLLVAVSAAPQIISPSSSTTITAPRSITPIGAEYYLQAQLVNKGPNDVVDNNYVSSYHSGAGENNVTLVARSEATEGFLDPNGGFQEFDLGVSYPWGFVMAGETGIRGASLVRIDAGSGDAGFSIPNSETGLKWNGTGFGGWLACEVGKVTTGLQLFWVNETGRGIVEGVPEGCERVKLVTSFIEDI